MVAPRRRSWGRNSSTTNSTIIGSETRKLPVHVQLVGGEVADDVAAGEAEHEGADERAGQAAQPAEHGGGEGVDHQQREGGGAHGRALDRRDEDAGQRGEERAQRPRQHGQPLGPPGVELEQVGVVDHRPHGHAGAGAEEQEAQRRARSTTAMHHGQHLVPGEVDAGDAAPCCRRRRTSGTAGASRGVGSQIQVARARNPSITLTGTTMRVTSDVPRRPRITTP